MALPTSGDAAHDPAELHDSPALSFRGWIKTKDEMQRENLPVSHLEFAKYEDYYRRLNSLLENLLSDERNAKYLIRHMAPYISSHELRKVDVHGHSMDNQWKKRWNDFVSAVNRLHRVERDMIINAFHSGHAKNLSELLLRYRDRYTRLDVLDRNYRCTDLLYNDERNAKSKIKEDPVYAKALLTYLTDLELTGKQQNDLYYGLAHDLQCHEELNAIRGSVMRHRSASKQRTATVPSATTSTQPPPKRLDRDARHDCHRRRVCASVLAYNNIPENDEIGHHQAAVDMLPTPETNPAGVRKKQTPNWYGDEIPEAKYLVFKDNAMLKAAQDALKSRGLGARERRDHKHRTRDVPYAPRRR